MIRFECPNCGQSVEIDDQFAGRKGGCPGCQRTVAIPRLPAAPGQTEPRQPGESHGRSGPLPLEGEVPPSGGGEGVGRTSPSPGPEKSGPPSPSRERGIADTPSTRGESPPAGRTAAGRTADRGPRKLTLPESVSAVVAEPPAERMPQAGRAQAVAGIILGCVPLASVAGIFLGAAAWSQASRADRGRSRGLALAALVISIAMTVASAALGFVGIVSLSQEGAALHMAECCRWQVTTLATELDAWAADNGNRYPSSLADLGGGHFHGMGLGLCPETGRRYGYVGGLVYDPSGGDATIILYDAVPSHGVRTWLWRTPPGRNVYRLDHRVEFLSEKEFQRVMEHQHRQAGP